MTGYFKKTLIMFMIIFVIAGSAFAEHVPPSSEESKRHNEKWGFEHKDGVVLALCGGGMKGLAHLGVFEVLEREKIPIAAIVGTSMGSIMGGLYASGMDVKKMHATLMSSNLIQIMSGRNVLNVSNNTNSTAHPNDKLLSFSLNEKAASSARLSILDSKDLYNFLGRLTSDVSTTDFNELPIPFAAVATDLSNGDTVILRNGNLASALRASMAFPIVFSPWKINGRLLVDGGMKANLPVIEAKRLFPEHPVIAVNLSQENIDVPEDKMSSLADIAAQTISILMIDQIRENVKAADLVITPDLKGFGTFTEKGHSEIILRGKMAAEEKLADIKNLVKDKCGIYAHNNKKAKEVTVQQTVADIIVNGVSLKTANQIKEIYEAMIGKNYDSEAVAAAVASLSEREDVRSIEGHTEKCGKNKVNIVFNIQTPPKYEFAISGFSSNLSSERWISLAGVARDMVMPGDSTSLEVRIPDDWGFDLRYFTAKTHHQAQFGAVLSGRKESYEPFNNDDYPNSEFERYSGKFAWYKSFGKRGKVGIGYAGMHVSESLDGNKDSHGPYLTISMNNLDDPILPTKGIRLESDIWYTNKHRLISETSFKSYIPIFKEAKVVFSGGFKTGDGNSLQYAAALGTKNELYSLGREPLVGDRAYWLHLGVEREFIRSWWGGLNMEIFGNYGQVFDGWNNSGSRWEAGAAFSVPFNRFLGKLILVYDNNGGFTIGYTIGMPSFRRGPLP